MITTMTYAGPFGNHTKWFSDRLEMADSFRLMRYTQYPGREAKLGFVRRDFQTKIIDLTATPEALKEQTSKNTLYKARRAERDGVTCHFEGDIEGFRIFYNEVAEAQSRAPIAKGLLESASPACRIVQADLEGETLVMHSYLADPAQKRIRLWHSASRHVMGGDSKARNAIGMANRLLHWECLLRFKEEGFRRYDFGGYSADARDQKKMAINKFKDGFGGEIFAESNYVSYPLMALLSIKGLFKGRRDQDTDAARDAGSARDSGADANT
ncbi:MAG: hypothetical protein ACRBM6_18355 [Geminicoccales bacterium]